MIYNGRLLFLFGFRMNNLVFKAFIPFFAKLPDQRFFQELPQGDVFFFAFAFGRHADAPFVVEDMGESVFFHEADGVEMAGDGFPEVTFAFKEGFLYGTEGGAVFMEINEGAFPAIHQGGDKLARLVVVIYIALFNHLNAFGTHVGFDGFEVVFYLGHFVGFERRTGVAIDATPSLATRKGAAELGVEKSIGDDDVINDYHAAKIKKKQKVQEKRLILPRLTASIHI